MRDDALSKRESSLEGACVLAFTGMKCRLTSLQPAFLLACSLAINCLFGCLRTHLFGCICRYSLLVLYLLLHLPLSSLVMMHSAKEKHHLLVFQLSRA